jgi:hypothetical protein
MQQEFPLKKKVTVVLTPQLSAQIQFLHNQCPKGDEWSGLLIYKVEEGDVKQFLDPKDDKAYLELRAEAVFPMDYGTATFTSFEGNEDWIKCFETFPQIDPMNPEPGWYIGKIHSHNTMPVFHSSTDKADIYENAPKLPMFLSLIVNYACEVDCELAVAIEVEETILTRTVYKLKNWATKDNNRTVAKKTTTHKPVWLAKCEVVYEQDEWLIEQAEALKKPVKTITHYPKTDYSKDKKEEKSDPSNRLYMTMLDNFADLVTLGTAPNQAPAVALHNVNVAVEVTEIDDYTKAVKAYFVEDWYDDAFMYNACTASEAIDAILKYLDAAGNNWLGSKLKTAFNELKTEYYKLRTLQGSYMVR